MIEDLERSHHRHARVALKWGLMAGLISGGVLALVRILVVSEIALLVVFVSPSPRLARLARGSVWVALKSPAYPFVGERSLQNGFDARVVALGIVVHFTFAITFGALFGLAALGRSTLPTLALGVLWGIMGFILETYALSHVIGGGLAVNPGVALLFLVYGLILALAFLRAERKRRRSP